MLSHVWFFVTPWTVARQAPLSMGFSRQEYQSGALLQGIFQTQQLNQISRSAGRFFTIWATRETLWKKEEKSLKKKKKKKKKKITIVCLYFETTDSFTL